MKIMHHNNFAKCPFNVSHHYTNTSFVTLTFGLNKVCCNTIRQTQFSTPVNRKTTTTATTFQKKGGGEEGRNKKTAATVTHAMLRKPHHQVSNIDVSDGILHYRTDYLEFLYCCKLLTSKTFPSGNKSISKSSCYKNKKHKNGRRFGTRDRQEAKTAGEAEGWYGQGKDETAEQLRNGA